MAEAVSSSEGKPHVIVHWLDQSRAQRIIWLLEECKGIDYTIDVYKREKDMLAPATMKKIHPLGKAPLVTVKAPTAPAEGIVLAESGLITEYLCDHFAPHLVPARWTPGKENTVGGETEQWLRYRFYMHYNEASLMTMILIALLFERLKTAPQPFFVKPITRSIAGRMDSMYLRQNFATHFGFLESQLATAPDGGEYLCGAQITAADILMSFPLFAGHSKVDKAAYPLLTAYTTRLEKNEVYLRSVKKVEEASGEPFKAML